MVENQPRIDSKTYIFKCLHNKYFNKSLKHNRHTSSLWNVYSDLKCRKCFNCAAVQFFFDLAKIFEILIGELFHIYIFFVLRLVSEHAATNV